MTGTDCGAIVSDTRIYSYCLYWHLRNLFFWMNTLLSLDIVERALILPQSNVLMWDSPLYAVNIIG